MKTPLFGLVLSLLTTWCSAQVTVEVVLDQELFLRNESLPVKLRITNYSGRTLRFGAQRDWLSFVVTSASREAMARLAEWPPIQAFDLDTTQVANLRMDLMPYFNLGTPGQYTVTATLRIPELDQELTTKAKSFNIISGTTLWEREFGLPGHSVTVVRKYAVQQANFLNQLRLYVRLTDAKETKVFGVVALGGMVSFARPEAQLDASSQLHVLFQNGPKTFDYSVITPDGELIIRQTHEYTDTRPVLKRAAEGRVYIMGGRRRFLSSDVPPLPPGVAAVTNAVPTNAVATNAVHTNAVAKRKR